MLSAIDLFCGAGGTSLGAEQAGASVKFAVNHWDVAVRTHSANFPHARHVNSRLDLVSPAESPRFDLLFASPECTHHSRARGGRPTSDQQRSGAWDIMRWIEHHRPSFIVVENVPEFREWGPVSQRTGKPLVSKRGHLFDAWLMAIAAMGYKVDHHILNAADFGAATRRPRLFVVARKGNRWPVFPEPTHGMKSGGELPGMERRRWRAAMEVIDWSLPCLSVFASKEQALEFRKANGLPGTPKRPLEGATLDRIAAGLRKFVGPFVAKLRTHGTVYDVEEALGTITAGGLHHGLAVPFQYQMSGRMPGKSKGIDEPVSPIVASCPNHGLMVPIVVRVSNGGERWGESAYDGAQPLGSLTTSKAYALAFPFLNQLTHGGRLVDPAKPLPTITTANRGETSVCVPFLASYYGTDNMRAADEPVATVTTKPRHGLACAVVALAASIEPRSDGERRLFDTMRELGVADVGFRMLQNHELSAAQGFTPEYIFHGNKADVTRQIGNSVSPPVAKAITRALTEAA